MITEKNYNKKILIEKNVNGKQKFLSSFICYHCFIIFYVIIFLCYNLSEKFFLYYHFYVSLTHSRNFNLGYMYVFQQPFHYGKEDLWSVFSFKERKKSNEMLYQLRVLLKYRYSLPARAMWIYHSNISLVTYESYLPQYQM